MRTDQSLVTSERKLVSTTICGRLHYHPPSIPALIFGLVKISRFPRSFPLSVVSWPLCLSLPFLIPILPCARLPAPSARSPAAIPCYRAGGHWPPDSHLAAEQPPCRPSTDPHLPRASLTPSDAWQAPFASPLPRRHRLSAPSTSRRRHGDLLSDESEQHRRRPPQGLIPRRLSSPRDLSDPDLIAVGGGTRISGDPTFLESIVLMVSCPCLTPWSCDAALVAEPGTIEAGKGAK